ncbi:hypothetical protein MPH_10828 [Macrophomina phaseolina MS6]|uniref:Uncharacterized protein n=1 Tax=Macrophomina phaseolina (strain MS6) TaxID=1126212 RepID=K2QQ97_MACPH|nr:hypothetical protein MPH_10828 [Macrophomina phaseolina MS6]
MYGPQPSRLVFLSDLKRMSVGSKARFLGCVDDYDVSTATLTLKHAYPTNSSVVARVNIEHVLETVQRTDLDVGAWVNVIAYVSAPPNNSEAGVKRARAHSATDNVHAQAIVLWSAGDIKLDAYQKAVEARKAADAIFSAPE